MLKYFKKQKSQCTNNDDGAEKTSFKRNSLQSTSSFCEEFLNGDNHDQHHDNNNDDADTSSLISSSAIVPDEEIFRYQSRLSISLSALVNVPNCLSYFVQYMETKDALSLIKFYLDIENFKTSALAQLERTKDEQSTTRSTKANISRSNVKAINRIRRHEAILGCDKNEVDDGKGDNDDDHDGGGVTNIEKGDLELESDERNAVPELKTLCDLTMRKPLTDDEKSRIYAETSKQIQTKYNGNHSTLTSLCSGSLLSLEKGANHTGKFSNCLVTEASIQDALCIYQKYLRPNAKNFVCLPLAILSNISLALCKCKENGRIKETAEAAKDAEHREQEDGDDDDDDDDEYEEVERKDAVTISVYCFDEAQQWILEEIERLYLNDFLQSNYYCKYCIELIEASNEVFEDNSDRLQTSINRSEDTLNIYDILYSERTLFFFMEFLEQNNERQCLDFWTTAINYRKSLIDATTHCVVDDLQNNADVMKSDAMIIYEKFFSLQADSRLWISDKLRMHVEELICATPERVPYCFDLPLYVTAKYLERKYFVDFLNSQLFENYLNELKTKVNDEQQDRLSEDLTDGEVNSKSLTPQILKHFKYIQRSNSLMHKRRHRKTLSDCSSENSIDFLRTASSQPNTHSSTDTSSRFKQLQSSGTSLSIDSRHLTNPDLLWHRSYSGLNFGRINSLGRYERDFETVDSVNGTFFGADGGSSLIGSSRHSWSLSGSKIKNAIRKLVHLPEEKAQEEIAWQVAEMIIKDVTSVTLNNNKKKG